MPWYFAVHKVNSYGAWSLKYAEENYVRIFKSCSHDLHNSDHFQNVYKCFTALVITQQLTFSNDVTI